MTKPVTFELLGPVDLGPEGDWIHLGFKGVHVALCGEATEADVDISGGIPGRCCPDCERIARERGLL